MSTLKVDPELYEFSFTDDEGFSAFLGLEIEETKNVKHLSQRYLIQRVLAALGLEKSVKTSSFTVSRHTLDTPAVDLLPIKDLRDTPREQQ